MIALQTATELAHMLFTLNENVSQDISFDCCFSAGKTVVI